jgi:chromosome segregation ATPase
LATTRKTVAREHEKYTELQQQKQSVDKYLKAAEKDYETAISTNQRLTEMNKDLQKSLMLVNEKMYTVERNYKQLEYETNSLKEKANDDAEGLTNSIDTIRKELHQTERKLSECVEALRLSKQEVEALHEEIAARDKVVHIFI